MVSLISVKKKTKIILSVTLNTAIVGAFIATYAKASGPYTHEDYQSIDCLAKNIYFETRASSLADAMSVSDVVLNRALHSKYPNTICGVVHDGYKKGKHSCQFSWYCDGKSDTPKNKTAWEKSRKYARDFYIHGQYVGITEGATHYHANYVSPWWAPTLDRVTRIGSHIFYRMKGK